MPLNKLKPKVDLTELSGMDFLLSNTDNKKSSDDIVMPTPVEEVVQKVIEKKKSTRKKKETPKQVQIVESPKQEQKINFDSNLVTLGSLKSTIKKLKKKVKETISEESPKQTISETTSLQQIVDTVNTDTELSANIVEEINTVIQEVSQDIKQQLHINDSDHTDTNVEEIIEEIEEVSEAIPDMGDDIELGELVVVEKKTKAGYTKTTVGFKKDTPKILSTIGTVARKASQGVIKPRTMDLRTIANTNKTQLRGNAIQLMKRSYVFKPDHTKLKVSKYNRFIISIEDDFDSTHKAYIYLQDSRSKFAMELEIKDQTDAEFIGNLIHTFYTEGYDVTVRRLQFRGTDNPLLRIIPNIVKSKQFKAKPLKVDDDSKQVKALLIKQDTGVNSWLSLIIQESKIDALYDVYLTADFDESWKIKANSGFRENKGAPLDIAFIQSEEFMRRMINVFNYPPDKFKKYGLDVEETDMRLAMFGNKLKYLATRQVLFEMIDSIEDGNNIEIVNVYSQVETAKLLDVGKQDDYKAEVIIVRNETYEYAIISYFAMQIIGGDKRSGRDYITTDNYYEKYSVKTRSSYDKRSKILRNEPEQRNYNARQYMFKVEYKKVGDTKKLELVKKSFHEINEVLNLI